MLSLGTGTSIKPAMVNQEFAGQGSWLLLNGPLIEVLTGGSQELGTSLETIDMLAVSVRLLTSALASHADPSVDPAHETRLYIDLLKFCVALG